MIGRNLFKLSVISLGLLTSLSFSRVYGAESSTAIYEKNGIRIEPLIKNDLEESMRDKELRKFAKHLATQLSKEFDEKYSRNAPSIGHWTTKLSLKIEDGKPVQAVKESSGNKFFDVLVMKALATTNIFKSESQRIAKQPLLISFTRDLSKNSSMVLKQKPKCLAPDFEMLRQIKEKKESGEHRSPSNQ